MIYPLIQLVHAVSWLFTLLILIRVILSWVSGDFRNPLVALVYRLTEPVLGPIRNLLPATGGLDFSPLIALVLVQVLERVVVQILFGMA